MANYKDDTTSWDHEQVRRSQRPPQKKKKKRRGMGCLTFLLWLIFVAVASVLLACVGWKLACDLCSFNQEPLEVTVEVRADDTIDTISAKLHDAGLIEYEWFFKLFAKVVKAEDKIGLGSYELNNDMDYHALVVAMRSSAGSLNTETVRVTIPEGYTVRQTIALLAKNNVAREDELLESAAKDKFDYDFIDNSAEDVSRLEGYLFPDTYDFYVGEKPKSALNRLIKNFNSKIDDEKLEVAESRGYNLKKIAVIASLIEKETDGSDHAKIASVIYNRLSNVGETAHLLQIDAALLYGLPEHSGPITNEDKEQDTPYNLYKHQGLPPTAIANPGLASIEAALEPDETPYYFYALGKDGKHHFFATYAEHVNFLNSGEYAG